MNKWLRRIFGTVGLCLAWAAGWAITGLLIGVASLLLPFLPWEPFFKVFDAPLPAPYYWRVRVQSRTKSCRHGGWPQDRFCGRFVFV